MTRRGLALGVFALLALCVPRAWALDGTTNQILVRNGAVALVVPISVSIDFQAGAATGTLDLDQTTGPTVEGRIAWDATNDEIEIGDGAAATRFIPVGTTTDTQFCTYQLSSNTIECATASTSINPQLFFSTVGDITSSTTMFATPGNVAGPGNEARIAVPTAVATYSNMRCESDVAITGANTVTVTARKSADATCASLADDLDQQCVLTGGADTCSDTTGNFDIGTAGICIAFSIVSSASAETAYVNCSIERTG